MAKTAQELLNQNNVNKGITTGLDSEATVKPQPSKDFNSGSNKTYGSNPESPSTNPATRREKYGISQGTTVPESTKIGAYDTVAGFNPGTYNPQPQQTTEDYLGAIKKLPGFSYMTVDFDKQLEEVQRYLQENGVDTTLEVYGKQMTDAAKELMNLNIQYGQLISQQNRLTNTQASNAKLVYTLAKEVWSGLAQGHSISDIARQLGQDEWVIQKIANNQTEELIQLNADYEEEQMREYLRYREDLDDTMARNIVQYNNLQRNLDYQFDSAMQTLKRSLFDAEWTARGTAAGLGMTGTEYTLNRIQAQYDQQIGDIRNTYNYQSANAQIAINNALEDYSKNLQRWAEDYATKYKEIQGYALQSIINIDNNIGLTADQMVNSLTTAYKNIKEAQSIAIQDYLAALEDGNTSLATQIANIYGLNNLNKLTSVGGGTYNPASQKDVDGALYTITSSSKYADKNKIRSGECGTIVNDYLGMIGAGFKISYASDMEKYINYRGTDPMVGSIAYFAPGSLPGMSEGGQKYGHVAIVTGVDKENGKITVRESNAGTGIRTHEYNMSDVDGYFNPVETTSEGGVSTEAGTYFDGDAGLYQKYLDGTITQAQINSVKLNKSYGNSEEERWTNFTSAAHAYQKVMTEDNAKTIANSIRKFQQLQDAWDAIGPEAQKTLRTQAGQWTANFWSSSSLKGLLDALGIGANDAGAVSHFLALYNNVKAQGFIDTLINSKTQGAAYGQLSDQEGSKITDAWSSLSLKDPINFGDTVQDELIDPLVEKLRSWGYTDEQIADFIGGKVQVSAPTSSTIFNTPGAAYTGAGSVVSGANYTGAQQSGTVNTGAQQMWGN